jgi:hypothetical protein
MNLLWIHRFRDYTIYTRADEDVDFNVLKP